MSSAYRQALVDAPPVWLGCDEMVQTMVVGQRGQFIAYLEAGQQGTVRDLRRRAPVRIVALWPESPSFKKELE